MQILKKSNKDCIHISWINFVDEHHEAYQFSFEGKKQSQILIDDTLYVGYDGIENSDDWRDIGFSLGNYVKKLKIPPIKISTVENMVIQEFFEGLLLSDYVFDKYKKSTTNNVEFVVSDDDMYKLYERAEVIVSSQCFVRDLVNTPFCDASAVQISKIIKEKFEKSSNITIKTYNEKDLAQEEMYGHLAVGRSSSDKTMTLEIKYMPKNATKTIILVGKGLVYDTGGYSLKPASSMTSMKADKAGALTVVGIIDAAAKLKLNVNIIGYACFADNAIGPDAYRPDDIITMKNKMTVHVKNTDAEGRIVLFDNLCLAQQNNPSFDEIYTLATLTGAAVVAFGDEVAAMVGYNKKMKKNIKKHGEHAGEYFVDAPFNKYMMKAVDDTIADLSNTGSKNAGCQKAGLFLSKAITKENKDKYLHLDIAGPAFVEKDFGTNIAGATGFGLRTFIKYFETF
jgi:leucyl aminopeptidase